MKPTPNNKTPKISENAPASQESTDQLFDALLAARKKNQTHNSITILPEPGWDLKSYLAKVAPKIGLVSLLITVACASLYGIVQTISRFNSENVTQNTPSTTNVPSVSIVPAATVPVKSASHTTEAVRIPAQARQNQTTPKETQKEKEKKNNLDSPKASILSNPEQRHDEPPPPEPIREEPPAQHVEDPAPALEQAHTEEANAQTAPEQPQQ